LGEVSVVPPGVEISIPVSVEAIEVGVLVNIHLFESFVEEVVKFVTAVVIAAAFTWAWWVAETIFFKFIGWVSAAAVSIMSITTS